MATPEVGPTSPFAARLRVYLDERFPPAVTLFAAAAFAVGLAAVPAAPWAQRSAAMARAGAMVFLFFFHLRIFDERKDHARDLVLKPERALSRGIVTLDELKRLGLAADIVLVAAAITVPAGSQVWWAAALGWSVLMLHEFGVSAWLNRHIFFYGLTHSAVVVLLAQAVITSVTPGVLAFDLGLVAMALAWLNEVSRKLDPTEIAESGSLRDESYVRDLGLAPTLALLGALVAIAAGISIARIRSISAGVPAAAAVGTGAVLLVLAIAAFARRPTAKGGKTVHGAVALLSLACYGALAAVGYR